MLKQDNSGFNYKITGPGTGDGFRSSARARRTSATPPSKIKDEEAAACAAAGIDYTELKIAIDGMTVMTSPENNAVTCLSFADLYALTGPQSTGFNVCGRTRRR